jgi:hypothetical protein
MQSKKSERDKMYHQHVVVNAITDHCRGVETQSKREWREHTPQRDEEKQQRTTMRHRSQDEDAFRVHLVLLSFSSLRVARQVNAVACIPLGSPPPLSPPPHS